VLRCRYAPSQARLFADFGGEKRQLRQEVAEDLLLLVNRFCDEEAVTKRSRSIDEETETVARCPNGWVPRSSTHDAGRGRTRTEMESSDCQGCEFRSQCPVREVGGEFVLWHTARERRVAARRAEQATDAFRAHYRIRSGGESVNSGLKRKMGMGRVRTRGSPRVRMAVLLRCAGWNILRALAALKKRGIRDFVAWMEAFCRISSDLRGWQRLGKALVVRLPHFSVNSPPSHPAPAA